MSCQKKWLQHMCSRGLVHHFSIKDAYDICKIIIINIYNHTNTFLVVIPKCGGKIAAFCFALVVLVSSQRGFAAVAICCARLSMLSFPQLSAMHLCDCHHRCRHLCLCSWFSKAVSCRLCCCFYSVLYAPQPADLPITLEIPCSLNLSDRYRHLSRPTHDAAKRRRGDCSASAVSFTSVPNK